MHGLLKQPGYRLYPPNSPDAGALLAEQGLGPADLERALARLETAEGIAVRTIVGINEDGVFGVTRAGWRPDLPDALQEPFIPLLWLKVHAAWPGARGQHSAVRQARHAAGRSPGWHHHLQDGQLKRRLEALTATDSTPPRPRARRRSLRSFARRHPGPRCRR
jgi:hypothetical protein